MNKNNWLQAWIDGLPGPRTIRMVLEPETARSSGMAFARIVYPDVTRAYRLESYAWVERLVSLTEEAGRGFSVFDVRRGLQAVARVISMEEEREEEHKEEDGEPSKGVKERYKMHDNPHVLHEPERSYGNCIFDTRQLMDLPPPGWPGTGSVAECRKNLLPDLNPTTNRVWAGKQHRLRRIETVEEQHAQRILDNERIAEYTAYRRRVQEAQALVALLSKNA